MGGRGGSFVFSFLKHITIMSVSLDKNLMTDHFIEAWKKWVDPFLLHGPTLLIRHLQSLNVNCKKT